MCQAIAQSQDSERKDEFLSVYLCYQQRELLKPWAWVKLTKIKSTYNLGALCHLKGRKTREKVF